VTVLIGRITGIASTSVRLSVCPFVMYCTSS